MHKFDLKFNQNFYFYTGASKHRNTIQLGVDILNIGNMLNPYWGNVWSINAGDGYGNIVPVNLTNPADVYTTGATPVFQFQKNGSNLLPFQEPLFYLGDDLQPPLYLLIAQAYETQ